MTYGNVEIRTPTDVVTLVENQLGCELPTTAPGWKIRGIEAGKLKRQMAKDDRCTIHNLVLAVEYCRRRALTPRTPAGICFYVEKALERASTTDEHDLDREIREAVTVELGRDDGSRWVSQLTRARGPARVEVYEQWRSARAG